MRWARLFADLEGSTVELARTEAELLAAELTDEWWGQTSWRDLVGGQVTLELRGGTRVAGTMRSANSTLMRLESDTYDVLVATEAVVEVVDAQRRADRSSRVEAALGWGSALRRLRDADEYVRVALDNATTADGFIDAVGRDFVRIEAQSGRRRIIVFGAITHVVPVV